jgi:hypothetical protein
MQIHELTRRQPLNELDIAGPDGLMSNAKAAYGALKQKGGVKDALRTATPGQGQGFASTADLVQSDFAKRMQAVKNNAAMKQVAANIQQQWEKTRKTLPAAQAQTAPTTQPSPAAPAAKTTAAPPGFNASNIGNLKATPGAITPPAPKPVVPKTNTAAPNFRQAPAGYNNIKTNAPGYGQVPKIQPAVAKPKPALVRENQHLTEAASLAQITDWFTDAVIPQAMSAHEAEYLQNPTIQATLKNIAAAENQPDDKKRQQMQAAEFLDLVSAAGAISQEIQAKQPRVAAAAGTGAGSAAPLASGAQAATSQLQKLAGLSATQIEALKKIFSGAPQVRTTDPNTANFLQALGIKTS